MTKIEIEAIDHVGVVVRNLEAAERFYVSVLGLRRHPARRSWLRLGDATMLHLVHVPDAVPGDPPHHALRHVALRVADLRAALRHLLDHDVSVFQVDFEGNMRRLDSGEDSLDFGSGALFARDPDGNTIELVRRA
jgi:catechol 2,3-dioxygenase-like lactoylglutathione lyase family enzyme